MPPLTPPPQMTLLKEDSGGEHKFKVSGMLLDRLQYHAPTGAGLSIQSQGSTSTSTKAPPSQVTQVNMFLQPV